MTIAVLGSGGREHALAWKLAQDAGQPVLVMPGNGGTRHNIPLDPTDLRAVEQACLEHHVDLLVVGPEAPLAAGLADRLAGGPIRVFGPSAAAARLESSKVWAKLFMERHQVATGRFAVADGVQQARLKASALGDQVVIKYDGLAAGKGVVVCDGPAEVDAALERLGAAHGAGAAFLIEEKLVGDELSIIAITDGRAIALLPPSQDHKQLLDNDQGPNTGGMGAFCPVPACSQRLLDEINKTVIRPTLAGLRAEGLHYCGALYFGLMITSLGPRLLEYNVRFGDPETEVLLPAMDGSLLALMEAAIHGQLTTHQVAVTDDVLIDVVLAAEGYPGPYRKFLPISGLDEVDQHCLLFHAGTQRQGGQVVTAGGRVLNVVARGKDLDQAITRAYQQVQGIEFVGMHYRTDIGRRPWVSRQF